MIELLSLCVREFGSQERFSGREIVNTIHESNKRREINEKLGDIRCRDQFFITCFRGEYIFFSFFLSLFILLHRFLSNRCARNMLRYVNYTPVIYKRLLAQTYTKNGNTSDRKVKQGANTVEKNRRHSMHD